MNDFEQFWSHYPLKKSKGAAKKKFESLQKSKQLPDVNVFIKAIHDQMKEKSHLKNQNLFAPEWKHPSTWLNQECWLDVCILPREHSPRARIGSNSIDNLQRALNILSNLGNDKFESFCRQIRLSDHDRECVLMAHRGGPRRVATLAQGMLRSL